MSRKLAPIPAYAFECHRAGIQESQYIYHVSTPPSTGPAVVLVDMVLGRPKRSYMQDVDSFLAPKAEN